ncbi:hypothetical protein HNY73_011304 [Argiope bruennichi]|uniref:Uncharacterized protein n=1 Tax=Argiope bruennichi TaxID=94029 RepID=A0A8T0F8Q2_ARGBR|nr:hypothetical protein HNY73_011304 [Argiope bruennichi]
MAADSKKHTEHKKRDEFSNLMRNSEFWRQGEAQSGFNFEVTWETLEARWRLSETVCEQLNMKLSRKVPTFSE